jgi:superfamily II DNA or RNA helicase
MILRDYQESIVNAAREALHTVRAIIILIATGGGKTPTACAIIVKAIAKGKKALFIAHRTELLLQASGKLRAFGVSHGVIKAGERSDLSYPVQVASVQTLARRLNKIRFVPDVIVIDEAHLAEAKSYKDILAKYPAAYIIGLTATPGRLDGRGLGKPTGNFDRIIAGPPMLELIDRGFLVPLRYFSAPPTFDLSGVHSSGGDYNIKELANVVDKPGITGDVVSHWKRIASDRKTLVFCVSIAHADHVAEQFRSAGISALAVNGKWDAGMRAMALADFDAGKINVLVNCQLYVEGIDIPAIGCVADLAPTQSITRYLQRAGRGMRACPGKSNCIYLDHANNVARFGLPTENREWTLEGSESRKKSAKRAAGVRVCPKCWAASAARSLVCVECGEPFKIKPRQELEERDGELVELTAEEIQRKRERREQGRAMTRQQLTEIARIKGRNPAWVDHVLRGRDAKLRKKERA